MDNPLLPYLNCLRATLGSVSTTLHDDPVFGKPSAVSARLVDRMYVDQAIVPGLRKTAYAQVEKLLPELKLELAATSADVLAELGSLCKTADPLGYERFRELTGEVQRTLLAQNTERAADLAKGLWRVDADYCAALAAAVEQRAAEQAQAISAGGTLAVRNIREIDEPALCEFLRKTFPQETELGIASTAFISGGYSKYTASITLKNAKTLPEQIILRGDGSATYGGASVTKEYGLIKAIHDNGVCVAKPLALEESGKVFGSPFLLVEKRHGSPFGNMFDLPEKPNRARGRDIAAKLAAIHLVPVAAVGAIDGADKPSSAKALAFLDEGHRNWLPLAMPSPVFEIAFDWLRRNAHISDRGPRALVHGDFSTNNLLFDGDKVTAVLDWEFAHIGCPAYDLGYMYYMARALCDWDEFLEAYGAAGAPVPDEEQINYNILLASTRLGVMVCQSTWLFATGKGSASAMAFNVSGCYYEVNVRRMAEILERVL